MNSRFVVDYSFSVQAMRDLAEKKRLSFEESFSLDLVDSWVSCLSLNTSGDLLPWMISIESLEVY